LIGAALSTDGKLLYTASNADIIIWQVSSGTIIGRLTGHTSTVNALALSGSGTQLVSGSDDATAIIWDVATRQIVHRLTGHTASIHAVAFSPDGRNVLTGSVDTTSRLWEAQTGAEIRRFTGHTQAVEGIVFSKLGQVTSLSPDGTVRVWHIQSPSDLIAWVKDNRYIRELSCDEVFRFDPQASCTQSQLTPSMTITPLPTNRVPLTLTPTPIATATAVR
jgi:WD40 repeat protein